MIIQTLVQLAIFCLLAIGLGFFNVRFLMLPITLGILIYNLVVYIKVFLTRFRGLFRFRYLLPIILLGVVIQGLINFPSGYSYNGELLFWSSQGHDGLWHVEIGRAHV